MKTYRAALAPWRMRPLHPAFVARAQVHARQLGIRRGHAYETTCPYCGVEDRMVGTIRIGAKEQVENVPMTKTGYVVPEAGTRETDILLIECLDCKAAIDPLAYISPAVFFRERDGDIPPR